MADRSRPGAASPEASDYSGGPVKRLVELDTLRGLMALWVYISHVLFIVGFAGNGVLGVLKNGAGAVYVFMMLSGFAISTSLIHSRGGLGAYAIKRVARIYPVYLVGLVLGMATSQIYPVVLQQTGFVGPSQIARLARRAGEESHHFLPHLLAHLTMIHGVIPDRLLYGSALSFNAPAWSLSLEAQYYVVAPVLLMTLTKPSKHLLWLAALVVIMLMGVPLARLYPIVPSFLPLALGYFVIGALTAIYFKFMVANPNIALGLASVIIAAALLAPLVRGLPLIIWASMLVICTVRARVFDVARRVLSFKPFVLGGEISYGFYIFHMPLLILWAKWLADHGYAHDRLRFGALLTASLPATLILAWFSYYCFERPISMWAKTKFGGIS